MISKSGKAASVPSGLIRSLTVNAIITVLIAGILAALISRNILAWNRIGYWIMATLFAASFLGGKIAIGSVKTQRYLIGLMSGLLYWMFLLCITALFFGGHFSSILETGALIFAGSMSAALLQFRHRSTPYQKKIRSYR